MRYESPKQPKRNWSYGIKYILRPLPKFALRIGVALTAASALGFTYSQLSEAHPEWALYMGWSGVAGILLTSLFGKK